MSGTFIPLLGSFSYSTRAYIVIKYQTLSHMLAIALASPNKCVDVLISSSD